jgi:hypothetical protein
VHWRLQQKIRSKCQKQYNTKSVANSKYKCAPVLCIHVSVVCNQQLAYCRVTFTTFTGSEMQSGAFATRTENQKQTSKTQHNTKSVTNVKHKSALVLCIHVSFACNQQLAYCRATKTGSPMQGGASIARTENYKQS